MLILRVVALFQDADRCPSGEVYRFSDWKCVNPETENEVCNKRCKDEGEREGTFNTNFGVCICTHANECDDECEKNRPKCSLKLNADGQLSLKYAAVDGSSSTFNTPSSLGISNHDIDEHPCQFIFFDSDRKLSAFIPKSLEDVENENQGQTPARRRRRAVGDNTTSATPNSGLTIPNPIICLTYGDSLLFKVEINEVNRSLSHYPRYRKNHLSNTNDKFDYGNFRQLHSLVQESNNSLSYFVHVFNQNGTFVFYDNAEPTREMYVTVKEQGSSCAGFTVSPITKSALNKVGVGTTQVKAYVPLDLVTTKTTTLFSHFLLR